VSVPERWPGHALVEALKGHTVIDASCDGEGVDDVRLRLENDVVIRIDATVTFSDDELLIEAGLAGPQARLDVTIGDRELWPHDE
jgi:hypothetical protein